jgi:hypothetical protein
MVSAAANHTMTPIAPPTVCLTLDLEPDYGRRVPWNHSAWDAGLIEALLAELGAQGIPLSVFIVGRSIEEHPQIVDRFRAAGAECHAHSYDHDLTLPDRDDEIRRAKQAFRAHFGRDPEGYRVPEGRITPHAWRTLEDEGFLFDASIYPSFWPRPHYLKYPRTPFRPHGLRLVEIPFATLTPLRMVVSVSFMKLLGWPFYRLLLSRFAPPEPFVFGMHLHDLWMTPSAAELRAPWSLVYRRNDDIGVQLLMRFIALMQTRGARFATLGQMARRFSEVSAC